MNFYTIETDRTFIKKISIKSDKVPEALKQDSIGILQSLDSMVLNGSEEEIKFCYMDSYNEVALEFKRSSNAIIRVLTIKDKIATLKIIIFAMPLENIYEKLYIRLDEKLLSKNLKESDFLLKINTQNYIVIASGNNAKDALFLNEVGKLDNEIKKLEKKREESIENKTVLEQKIQERQQKKKELQIDEIAFTLLSDEKRLAVERINAENNSILYKATKLMERTQKEIAGLRLVKLKEEFSFKDGSMRASIKDALESGELASQYLEKWDEYAAEEGKLLLQRAREIGEIQIKEIDNFTLMVDTDLRDRLDGNDFICVMDNTPPYLQDKEMTFEVYLNENITTEICRSKKGKDTIETYKIENIQSDKIQLEKQENMNLSHLKGKKFSLSIFGSFVALKRKYKARQRMLDGKSANPILPMIFASEISENLKQTLQVQQKNTYPPLSDSIRKKIFKNEPTNNQIEAIKMAINTKDIAIIQGPPGTGKTTVLNAIVERLNELNDKDLDKKGSIFIGGFQHSAVENLIQRMNLNGIPTPKYGKKSNEIQRFDSYESIMEWSEKIANNIKIKEDSNHIKDFKELAANYCKRPSQSKQKEILQSIINTKDIALRECRDVAREMLISLNSNEACDFDKNLPLIYAIRGSELSFNDDGVERNADLLASELKDLLSDEEKSVLKNKCFSKDLVRLKKKLIKRFIPKPKFEKEKPNKEVLEIIEKAIESLNNLTRESQINVVLAEFKQKLLSNPFALQDMLKDYSVVFSATIGQSASGEILNAKGVKESETEQYEKYSYDTVIIDEAAMVSPLDLFLVLVLAKHRIILVGDHRQLPHMLDDRVLQEMENNTEIESALLKESMFSFLKQRAQDLENIDGIRRFITLNNQFRTHPLLGDLVSDIFYKEYGEAYKSPLDESYFQHKLKGIENIPAVWIHLSKDKGRDERNGTSRMRQCEVKVIESKLIEYLNSQEGAELSYGVISFYRAQVEEIKKGIEVLKKDSQYKNIKEALERIKVGSVDQFQGNEFDIVFLSTVRSGVMQKNSSLQSAFGFLAVPNRLCVAMSRQKKCLIAVGDMEYFQSDAAREHTRGLYEFASLCKSKGRVL